MREVASGSQDAFATLIRRYQDPLLNFMRPQTVDQVLQAAEVIGHQEEHAGQPAVFQFDKHQAPAIDDLVAPEGLGAKHLLAGVEIHADDQEMNRLFDLVVLVFEVEFLGIDIQDQPVWSQGPLMKDPGFLFEFAQQGLQLLAGGAQPHGLQRA